ncbi:MFS transporter [Pseudonocardia thermophila]|uniref:MFS transporter n=1 Tax=Pseudonocardia thermophila TaxID=1848 RepID=UPI00248D91FC|nr:MFS transporter [Pseudonocardia thermophila]
MSDHVDAGEWSPRRLRLVLAALLTGTLLAPLNSSMVAVALYPVQQHFAVPLATAGWVVIAFYLTSCIAQPMLGRAADLVGPRRLFLAGMLLAAAAAVGAALAPALWVLVGCRILHAVGGSTAYPCAMVIVRRHGGGAARLTGVATVNTAAAAIGPVLGGALTSVAGWQAIFWINLPLALGAFAVAAVAIGPDERRAAGPGRVRTPFVDLAALRRARGVRTVLGTFVLFNLAYYAAFYGLPQWLQDDRNAGAAQAGLLILPLSATSVAATVLGAAVMRRCGVGPTMIAGGALLLAGAAVVVTFGPGTPMWVVVLDGIVLGIPYGLCNLGLQRLMYHRAPPRLTGSVGGLFQSARYTGAILAVGLVGVLAGAGIGPLAVAMTAIAAIVVALLVSDLRRARERVHAGSPA